MRKKFGVGLGLFSCLASFFVQATELQDKGLCRPAERVVFSCSLQNGKSLSFCGAPEQSSSEYVEYRYGKPGKVELNYRAEKGGKKIYFFDGLVAKNQSARVPTIFFKSGKYGYFLSIPYGPEINSYETPTLFVNLENSEGLDSASYFKCAEDGAGKGVFSMNIEPVHSSLTTVSFASFKLWQARFKRANSYHVNP